jgi:ABC-type multidrug transport system ATPase subunit
MKINLENIGRRFNREWIFKKVDYQFETGGSYAILGANGSGKSTLLQIIAGSLTPSEGHVTYHDGEKNIDAENIYQSLGLSTPYLELIEEFSLSELADFHFNFKNYLESVDKKALIELLGFEKIRNKPIRHYSSGMKQRVKLALTMCSDTPIVLLDEPTANLDKQGVEWYLDLIRRFGSDRLLIVCSNQEHEYQFCDHQLQVMDYKDFSSEKKYHR